MPRTSGKRIILSASIERKFTLLYVQLLLLLNFTIYFNILFDFIFSLTLEKFILKIQNILKL